MKLRITMLLILPCVLLVAQEQKQATRKSQPAKQPSAVLTIPAGAKEIEPYTYRYIDKDGKKWIYRQTPFGVRRVEDKPEEKPAEDVTNNIKFTQEEGESLRFERQTPFGLVHWVRKKTELNESERAAWDRARSKQPGSTPGGK